MIRKCDKPDVFKELTGPLCFIEGYDKSVYAYMSIDFRMPECAVLHLEVLRFSHTILKNLLLDLDDVRKILKENNVKTMAVTRIGTVKKLDKWIKFIGHFGFNNLTEQVTVVQEV